MRISKIAVLFLTLLLMAAPLLSIPTTPAEANPVYYSVEPVAISPLTNINSSINGLETPPTPSPIGQNFTVEIHLVGATADNVPAGVEGVEIHFYFGNILTYAVPTGFTNMLGQPGEALTGPSSQLLSAITAGLYDASGKIVSGPPYTGAVYYKVASASMAGGWNGADGLMANLTFQIIKQPQSGNGETTAYLPLACDFTDITDANAIEVTHDTIQGTLTIDATPAISQQNYTLTANVVGNGAVTKNPLSATYASGSNVTLTAVPGSSWAFAGWSGDVTGTQNPVNIIMNGNKTVTATFAQLGVSYNLTVNVVGNGTVTENPFNATYLGGTVVALTAVPGFNWTFAGWTGDLVSGQNPVNITMTANKNVIATFTFGQQYYNLTVNILFFTNYTSFVQSGQIVENASVTQTPAAASYLGGTTVALNAVPGLNWTFWGWSGDVIGTQNQTSFTINANMNVTATFGLTWDFNHDGRISLSDLNVFVAAWKSTPSSANWNPQCDLAEPKGIVSLTDLATFAIAYWWLGA